MLLQHKKRQLYILAPLFLLLACLVVINLTSVRLGGTGQEQGVVATIGITAEVGEPAASVTLLPTSTLHTATPLPTTTAVPTLIPTIPPGMAITLLGPPNESALAGDSITFYWNWPLMLDETQHFAVYLRIGDEEQLLGVVAEPNVGSVYRLQAGTEPEWETAPVQWQVRLETVDGLTQVESEIRSLSLGLEPPMLPPAGEAAAGTATP